MACKYNKLNVKYYRKHMNMKRKYLRNVYLYHGLTCHPKENVVFSKSRPDKPLSFSKTLIVMPRGLILKLQVVLSTTLNFDSAIVMANMKQTANILIYKLDLKQYC